MLLVTGQKFEELGYGVQQYVWIAVVQVCPRQEIRTDHLQTVPPRLIRAEHQGRCVDGLLNHWNLALVDLEIDNFPGLLLFPAQFLLHLPFKILGRHLTGSVQPDCTFESLPIPPRQLRRPEPRTGHDADNANTVVKRAHNLGEGLITRTMYTARHA